jgi:RecB family exonuclease
VQREVWVSAKVSTALSVQDPFATLETDSSYPDTVLVRGIIDRLDMTQINGEVCLRLIDYKTGKAPAQHYSPPTNARIREEAFSALYLYALLLRESHRAKRKEAEEKTNGSTTTTNNNYLPVRFVQLFYLNDAYGRAVRWEEDIGATEDQRDAKLWEEQQHVARVYRNMWELVQQQDPKAWSGCNRSFCYCHKCRGRFVPDTVWEPAA